jgi:hypothetical protein
VRRRLAVRLANPTRPAFDAGLLTGGVAQADTGRKTQFDHQSRAAPPLEFDLARDPFRLLDQRDHGANGLVSRVAGQNGLERLGVRVGPASEVNDQARGERTYQLDLGDAVPDPLQVGGRG